MLPLRDPSEFYLHAIEDKRTGKPETISPDMFPYDTDVDEPRLSLVL